MNVPRKSRSWRQSLADDFEEEYGPLPDPVATFGSELVTAPPTPASRLASPVPIRCSSVSFMSALSALVCEIQPTLNCRKAPAIQTSQMPRRGLYKPTPPDSLRGLRGNTTKMEG
ncbi:Hypothetical protein NCS54_00874800 [Fusarium falciforme]|uniref:Hypothetical protein n=1 Tax=Fusarium falciforme TaxID=195108 RepID=UPI0023006030|nr:Hypothetical protein NCS54_00874800 [Fusarium falciforme]WAO91283.1 Hypothetical protein NCS54_00874800 [Fusarium falciforme]